MACDNYGNGAIFRTSVVGRWNDASDTINVYETFLVSGGITDMTEVRISLRDYFDDLYNLVKLICSVVQVFEGIKVSELDGDCATGLVPFSGGSIDGVLDTGPVPPGVAALLSFPTGVKRVVMRKYFPGLDESVIGVSGNIAGSFADELNDIGDFLMAPQTFNGLQWRYGYRTPKGGGQWLLPIGFSNTLNPAYQRRRRRGTGN